MSIRFRLDFKLVHFDFTLWFIKSNCHLVAWISVIESNKVLDNVRWDHFSSTAIIHLKSGFSGKNHVCVRHLTRIFTVWNMQISLILVHLAPFSRSLRFLAIANLFSFLWQLSWDNARCGSVWSERHRVCEQRRKHRIGNVFVLCIIRIVWTTCL